MRLSRRRRRGCRGQGRFRVRLLRAIPPSVPVVSLLVYTLTGQPTNATLTRYGKVAAPVAVTFRSFSAAEALELHPGYIDLGTIVTNQPVDSPPLVVRNVSTRTLSLSAQVKQLPGLHVKLEPSQLEPGESATLVIYGRPGKPGSVQGYVRLTAFDGYLEVEIPVTGRVKVPPEEACGSTPSDFSLSDEKGRPSHCEPTDEQLLAESPEELPSSEADGARSADDSSVAETGEVAAEPSQSPEAEAAVPIVEPFLPPSPGEVPIVEPFDHPPSAGPAPIVEDFGQDTASREADPKGLESDEVWDADREAADDADSRRREPSDKRLEDGEPGLAAPSSEEVPEPS